MATKKKVKTAYKTESRLKAALFYAVEILLDIMIVYVIVRGFSVAYSFSYEVFSDSAKNRSDTTYVVVNIQPDFTTSSVSELLYDKGVIKNKYVMMAKIKLNGAGSEIKVGKYGLSPSMTYNEILQIITSGVAVSGKDGDGRDSSGTGNRKLTTEPTGNTEVTTEAVEGSDGGEDGQGDDSSDGDSSDEGSDDEGSDDGESDY